MNTQVAEKQARENPQTAIAANRPRYVTPRIQAMTEKEILSTFQITQSMATWWAASSC